MSATAPLHERCTRRRAVDQHFARRLSPLAERTLRLHLAQCADCHRHYQRRLAVERLDPRRRGAAQQRLAIGLGLQRRALPAGSKGVAVAAALLLGVGMLAVRAARGDSAVQAPELLAARSASALHEGFAARGGGAQEPEVLRAFRIRPGAAPEPATGELAASDELAFGYLNPGSRPWLLVYGVDEHGHVYWFHPSWDDPARDPAAVPAQGGSQLHELPEAISHALDGRQLTVHAVLSEQRLTVRQVERLRQGRAAGALLPLQGAEQTVLELRVTP